jgi:hypothetical protein
VADAAGVDPDQDLTWTGGGPLALLDGYLAVLLLYDYRFHRLASSAARRTGHILPGAPGSNQRPPLVSKCRGHITRVERL